MGFEIPIELPTNEFQGNDCPNCTPGQTPRYTALLITDVVYETPEGWYLLTQGPVACRWEFNGLVDGIWVDIYLYRYATRCYITITDNGGVRNYGWIDTFSNCCSIPPTGIHNCTIENTEVWS